MNLLNRVKSTLICCLALSICLLTACGSESNASTQAKSTQTETIDDLESQISELQEQNQSYQDEIEELQRQIDELESQLEDYQYYKDMATYAGY